MERWIFLLSFFYDVNGCMFISNVVISDLSSFWVPGLPEGRKGMRERRGWEVPQWGSIMMDFFVFFTMIWFERYGVRYGTRVVDMGWGGMGSDDISGVFMYFVPLLYFTWTASVGNFFF